MKRIAGPPRLAVCLATAVTVAATAYLCGWLNSRQYYVRSDEYVATRKTLEFLRAEIERYRETAGRWPETLAAARLGMKRSTFQEKMRKLGTGRAWYKSALPGVTRLRRAVCV